MYRLESKWSGYGRPQGGVLPGQGSLLRSSNGRLRTNQLPLEGSNHEIEIRRQHRRPTQWCAPNVEVELANRWFKLDENIVCARPDGTGPDKGVYVLQSQAGAGNWADEVEGSLGDAFRRAARAAGLPEAVHRKLKPQRRTRKSPGGGVVGVHKLTPTHDAGSNE